MERYTADLSKPPAAAAASDSVGTSLFEWFFCDTGFYPGTAVPRKRYEWGDAVLQHYWYFRHGMAERNFRVRLHGQANVEGPNTHERNLQELIYGNYITQQSNQAEYKRRLAPPLLPCRLQTPLLRRVPTPPRFPGLTQRSTASRIAEEKHRARASAPWLCASAQETNQVRL